MAQGKGSRAKSKERRAKDRRAQKASMQTQYEKWSSEGRNSKSLRARVAGRKTSKVRVADPKCKNIGDVVHYPHLVAQGIAHMNSIVPDQYRGKFKGMFSERVAIGKVIVRGLEHGFKPMKREKPWTRTCTGKLLQVS